MQNCEYEKLLQAIREISSQGNCRRNSVICDYRIIILILILLFWQSSQARIQYFRCIFSEIINYFICSNRQLMCRSACVSDQLLDCCINSCGKCKGK